MVKKNALTSIEKFLNRNCFYLFLFLFTLILCYVMEITNRPVKENLTNKQKRKMRIGFQNTREKYNNKIENLEYSINKGIRNLDRKKKNTFKDGKENLSKMFKKFTFK